VKLLPTRQTTIIIPWWKCTEAGELHTIMVCTITHCCSLFPATPLESLQNQRLIRVEYHAFTQPLSKIRWVSNKM
jgi:hypothetical protein